MNSLGLGCAPLGNLYRAIGDDQSVANVDAAWDAGMRFFDTAPYYGLGLSERRLGDALRHRPRATFQISTKVGRLLDPDTSPELPSIRHGFASPLPFQVRFDYGYDGIMRSYEASLQRLGLARIDILLVHDIGRTTHGDEDSRHFADFVDHGYRALDELRRNGDIQAFGLGVNEWDVCQRVMAIGRFDYFLLAGRYTLLEHGVVAEFLPQCLSHGARLILGGVYNSGILATGTRHDGPLYFDYEPAPQRITQRVARLEQICATHNVTLAAAALQFPFAHPAVERVIPGLGDAALVRHTIALLSEEIPTAFWAHLRQDGLLHPQAPVPGPGGFT